MRVLETIAVICLTCVIVNGAIDIFVNWRVIRKLRTENQRISAENSEMLKDNRELVKLLERCSPHGCPCTYRICRTARRNSFSELRGDRIITSGEII